MWTTYIYIPSCSMEFDVNVDIGLVVQRSQDIPYPTICFDIIIFLLRFLHKINEILEDRVSFPSSQNYMMYQIKKQIQAFITKMLQTLFYVL